MAEIPRPPEMTKTDLADLARYHRKLAEFLEQLLQAQSSLSFAENLGALMTEPTAVTVTGSGNFGDTGLEVPCDFEPSLVLFKAVQLDANSRPTGEVANGCVRWRTGTRSGADGFTAISGSYLTAARYNVTIIAFRG
jgi:hypothetical protein